MSKFQVPRLKSRDGGSIETTPANLLAMSQTYCDAAQYLLETRNVGLAAPLYMLVCNSYELALKSYILQRTNNVICLQKLGHNLSACWKRCLAMGLEPVLADEIEKLVMQNLARAIDELSDFHRAHIFRYMPNVEPFTIKLVPEDAVSAAHGLCYLIAKRITSPA